MLKAKPESFEPLPARALAVSRCFQAGRDEGHRAFYVELNLYLRNTATMSKKGGEWLNTVSINVRVLELPAVPEGILCLAYLRFTRC